MRNADGDRAAAEDEYADLPLRAAMVEGRLRALPMVELRRAALRGEFSRLDMKLVDVRTERVAEEPGGADQQRVDHEDRVEERGRLGPPVRQAGDQPIGRDQQRREADDQDERDQFGQVDRDAVAIGPIEARPAVAIEGEQGDAEEDQRQRRRDRPDRR